MRVLLVNAYPAGNARGVERFDKFRAHVLRIVKELERTEVTDVELVERTRADLDDFLFEMHSEFVTPQSITNFDRLDFVLVDGDASALPWSPALRKLALLTKMCMMTGKCLFASGLGAALLAYVCSTGGEHFRVLNNDGKGSLIDDVRAIPPPPPPLPVAAKQPQLASSTYTSDVLLDTKSGDFFAFSAKDHCWVPQGNTGLVLHSSDHARDYGAKPNSARAGTKPAHRERLSQPLCLSKRGETKCCIRLELANHALFTSFAHREFIVNCKSKWDLDEEIASTGTNRYRVLLDSSRGPMLVEFGNSVGSHFALSKEYSESCKLLRNFVLAKYEELKVHAHIDRSYVSAISGSSRLKDRLNQAQTKSVLHSKSHTRGSGSDSAATAGGRSSYDLRSTLDGHTVAATGPSAKTMTAGRTSPKRCRPVSAGPSRSASKVTHPIRTIKTSRSAYPSTSALPFDEDTKVPFEASINDARLDPNGQRSNAACMGSTLPFATQERDNNSGLEPATRLSSQRRAVKVDAFASDGPEVESFSSTNNQKAALDAQCVSTTPGSNPTQQRRVRVLQKNERERPYCAIHRFNKLRDDEKQQFYSVVNDAPYVGVSEREALEHQKNKLKWTAGPFLTAVGNATTHAVPLQAGIFATGPFVQENAPFYIIQRRELELRRDHSAPSASSSSSSSSGATAAAVRTTQSRLPQRPRTANYKR